MIDDPVINIADDTPQQPVIDFSANPNVVPDRGVAESRAQKAFEGLGGVVDRPYSEYLDSIVQGRDQEMRNSIASSIDEQRQKRITYQVQDMLKAGPLDPKAFAKITSPTPTNADMLYENYYATSYIGGILANDGDYADAKRAFPNATSQTEQMGSMLISRRLRAIRETEDIEAEIKQQSTAGYVADWAKGLFPGYSEIKQRGNVANVGIFQGGFLGSNLNEQALALLRSPNFDTEFPAIMKKMRADNPQQAMRFAQAVVGMSTSDIMLGNMDTAFQLSMAPDIATFGRGIYGSAIKGLVKAGVRDDTLGAVRDIAAATRAGPKDVANAAVNAVKSATQSVEGLDKGIPNTAVKAEAVGDVKEAAVIRAADRVDRQARGETTFKDDIQQVPSHLRIDADEIEKEAGKYSRELMNRITDPFRRLADNLVPWIATAMKVDRLPGFRIPTSKAEYNTSAMMRVLESTIKDDLPGNISNAVLDVNMVRDPVSNTLHGILDIGQNRGTLFFRKTDAINFAKSRGILEYEVKPKGAGYFIRTRRPLNETDSVVRDLHIRTKHDQMPGGPLTKWVNSLIGRYRTPNEVLSATNIENRTAATVAPSRMLELADSELNEIRKLSKWTLPGTNKKQRWLDWQRVVKDTRNRFDETTQKHGRNYKNLTEFDEAYETLIHRLPDDQERAAYFAFVRFNELDRALRNARIYTNKTRLGVMSHTISRLNENGDMIESMPFDGVVHKGGIPHSDTILNLGRQDGLDELLDGEQMWSTPSKAKKLDEAVKRGEKTVLEIYEPDARPLSYFSKPAAENNSYVRYAIIDSDRIASKPISWNQLPRTGGGHFDYDYPLYVKQGKVHFEVFNKGKVNQKTRAVYTGDNTLFPVMVKTIGDKAVKHLNAIRELIKNGESDVAKSYHSANGHELPIDWDELSNMFKDHTINGTNVPARLNLHEPIGLVSKNKLLIDTDNSMAGRYTARNGKTFLEDGTRRGSMSRMNQVQYSGERDAWELHTINDVGTQRNPLFRYEPADMIDPIPTMNRAMTRITHSLFMDDYKIFSVEHWMQEAKQYLKNKDQALSSPFHTFINANEKETFLPDTPPEIRRNLMNARDSIQQFIGQPSSMDALLDRMSLVLNDTIYNKGLNAVIPFGTKLLPKFGAGPKSIGAKWNPGYWLPRMKDPVAFVRSMVTHSSLGLFNPAQLVVQAMTFVDTIGIAGFKHAPSTLHAIGLHGYAAINRHPEILDHLDRLASSFSMPGAHAWKPGEWREAFEALQRTGFGHVGHEYSMLDFPFHNNVVVNRGRAFLDAGMWFFKGGERFSRLGAWYTAFKEFRLVNPTRVIDDLTLKEITTRADLLSMNMTKASNSRMQSGLLSIPLQFYTYQLRKFELMTGQRLTTAQRARLIFANAVAFGVPAAAGSLGYPFGDHIKKYAIEHGYQVGDNFLADLGMNGLPAMMIALATGGGDTRAGNLYNVGDRFSTKGFDNLESMVRGDKTIMDLAGGAAYSKLKGAWEAAGPFWNAMMSAFRDDDKVYPIKADDVFDVFKTSISSLSLGARTYMALQTGNYLSTKGNLIDTDISRWNALFMAATGLQPQASSDLNLISWSLKDKEEAEKYALKQFAQQFHLSLRAGANNQPEESVKYGIRAFALLRISGYPQDKIMQAIQFAGQDEPLIKTMNWNLLIKKAPDELKPQLMDAYSKFLKNRELQGKTQ